MIFYNLYFIFKRYFLLIIFVKITLLKLIMYDKHKYKSTIETLLKSDLSPTTNWHQSFSSNVMLIRHDIDFSVDLA